MARAISKLVLAATAAAALALMTGCAPEPAPTSTPVAAASPTAVPVAPIPTVTPTATPEPEPTPELCAAGTLLAIWAHYDDDLIFGHSRVADALNDGWCVTIAYLSAGDAGRGVDYSRGREDGIKAAYDTLRGYDGTWNETTDVLETGVTVEEWTPATDPRLELLSFRLVDGNIDGSGFAADDYESLAKLAAGSIPTVRDVDGPEALTRDDIVHSLAEIMLDADPDALLLGTPAEAAQYASGDHSDHVTGASFARAAWQSVGIDPGIVQYAIGYPSADLDANVSGDVLAAKVAAFAAYAALDPVVANCRDLDSCLNLRGFGAWLQREYSRGEADLGIG